MDESSRSDSPELLELVDECCRIPLRQAAWERFFARFNPTIQLYVRISARNWRPQDQDDLCQAIWVRMPHLLKRFNPAKGTLAAFLKTVATRAVRSEWRHRRQEREFIQPADQIVWELVSQSPEEQDPELLFTLILDYLRANVKDDDVKTLQALRVYEEWIEGKSYQEIMKTLGLSRPVVFRRLKECRRLVRWALNVGKNNSSPSEIPPPSSE